MLTDVPDIDWLAAKASSLLPFAIINVLYGYAYVARLYNGEHLALAVESADAMLRISESLGPRGIFSDVSLAVGACLSRLECPSTAGAGSHFVSRAFSVGVVDDVCKMVAGARSGSPSYLSSTLSDCHRVFCAARKAASRHADRVTKSSDGKPHRNVKLEKSGGKPDQNTKSESERAKPRVENGDAERRRYRAVEKKLEYFVSWSLSNGQTLLDQLPPLELESCELTTQLAAHRSQHARVEELLEQRQRSAAAVKKQGCPLIEEI